MNLAAVLVTGLFAGGVSCAAVQGGLLAGLIARQRSAQAQPAVSPKKAPTVEAGTRSRLNRISDDLSPVGGFLAGKLLSHGLLGALLGTVGGAVQLSLGLRTWLQMIAGVTIVVFGLAQLGVPGLRRIVIEPPASWMRLVRSRARSQTAFAPALLGVATVLIPCGVTLSVEALALASGSALGGAAIMAVFVVGTGPLFTVLGYVARKAATAWHGKLAMATGLTVVALGLYTLNGGLELAGSPVAASQIVQANSDPAPAVSTAPATPPGRPSPAGPVASAGLAATDGPAQQGKQTVTITARTDSYSPSNIQAKAGVPTTLVVTTDRAQGCVRGFVIPALNIEKILPADGKTRIELGVLQPGRLRYFCAMGMFTGTITAV